MGKNCSKSFSNASNSSDIEEEVIKQINTLIQFYMEPRKAQETFCIGRTKQM